MTKWLVILIVFTIGQTGRTAPAQWEKSVEVDQGVRVALEKGRLVRRVDGDTTWSMALPKTAANHRAGLVKVDLGKGLTAIHVRVETAPGGPWEAVLINRRERKSLRVIWKESVGLKGDPGERISWAVRFHDLSGDGLPEIVIGELYEPVRLCGKKELPLLFRKVYDLEKNRFRPVLASRPGLGQPIDLVGARDPNDDPSRPSIAPVYSASVSRSLGDRGRAKHLTPPRALLDGADRSVWSPVPGNGSGEFATFALRAPAYGLTRVGIRPLPATKRPGAYDRPRTLLLVTETRTYRLGFAEDPLNQPAETVWFDLPKPDNSGCFSLVAETSYAPSDNRRLALAKVVVRTEAERGEGLLQIARDLLNGERRRQAALLLERAGSVSLPAIETVWPDLDRQGRLLAVKVIGRTDPVAGAPLLVDALINGTEAEREAAGRGLQAAGQAAVAPLAVYLASEDEPRIKRAVRGLASINNASAMMALAETAGRGDRSRRALLRSQMASLAARHPPRTVQLGELIGRAHAQDARELLYDLLRAGAGRPSLGKQISRITNRRYTESEAFPDRYRLLELMGRLPCAHSQNQLAAAAKDQDHLIRTVAVTGLGSCKNPVGNQFKFIAQALKDRAPEVRLAALGAVRKRSREQAVLQFLTALAHSDPWPEVRAQVATGAGRLPPREAVPILKIAIRDPSPRVRRTALESAAPITSPKIDTLIEERLLDQEELPQLKRMAADIAGARCQKTAVGALFALLQKGAEPLAAPENTSTALAAARAMGAIGGEHAEKLLKKAKTRSNPATDRAIQAALKTLGQPCRGL